MINSLPTVTTEVVAGLISEISQSPLLYLLLGLVLLDFVTGISKAFITGQYSSKVGINGLVSHTLVIVLVLFLKFFGRLFGLNGIVYTMTLLFSFNYLSSIIENLEALGVEFPESIKSKFKQMRDDVESEIVIEKDDEIVIKKSDRKGVDR